MRRFFGLIVVLAAALTLGACGGDDVATPDDGVTGSRTLTVYASVPLQGEAAIEARDAVDAIKLALSDAGGRVGPFTVNLAVLDDATRGAGGWDRDQTLENAARAARDRNAIAVIGDWDSDASALSIPAFNAAEVAQVSPAASYVGLTRPGGVGKGEPDKFYPSGKRTFARVVPADDVQSAAIVSRLRAAGVRRVALVNDRSLYGKGLAGQVRIRAERAGIEVVVDEAVQPAALEYTALGADVATAQAQAVVLAASVRNGAVAMARDVGRTVPRAEIFAGEALLLASFARRIPRQVAERVTIIAPAVGRRGANEATSEATSGASLRRSFPRAFTRRFDRAPTPMAGHAYAAMQTVIAAIRRAGKDGNDRAEVIAALRGLTVSNSPIGETFTLDGRGDVNVRRLGLWRVDERRLVPAGSVVVPG